MSSTTSSLLPIILTICLFSFIGYALLCFALFLIKDLLFPKFNRKQLKNKPKGLLLVIAHPDDEVMFFGPTILDFTRDKEFRQYFHVLCLSNGDHDGVGKVRTQELWNCCKTLGIKSSNITLLKYDTLKDGPANTWSPDLIAKIVLSHAQKYYLDTIVTFDQNGVSGHTNHCSIYRGMEVMLEKNNSQYPVQVFVLESVNILRKYCMNVLDVPLSYVKSNYMYTSDLWQRANVVKGMNCHKSQLKWYRILYIFFSRYTIVNTLRELTIPGAFPDELKSKDN